MRSYFVTFPAKKNWDALKSKSGKEADDFKAQIKKSNRKLFLDVPNLS